MDGREQLEMRLSFLDNVDAGKEDEEEEEEFAGDTQEKHGKRSPI
jgi:hypothetical protein